MGNSNGGCALHALVAPRALIDHSKKFSYNPKNLCQKSKKIKKKSKIHETEETIFQELEDDEEDQSEFFKWMK